MTKTSQDAITLTRQLNIQYIWIDSLCVIQDDESDWPTEATKMAGIYANTELVISAASSSDGTGGLFNTRKPVEVIASEESEGACKAFKHVRPYSTIQGDETITYIVRDTARHAQWDASTMVAQSSVVLNPLLSRA